MKQCVFCKIYKSKKNVFYESDFFYIHFDAFPVSPGHLEIIPKRHIVSFFDLKSKEWQELQFVFEKAKEIVESVDFKEIYEEMLLNPLSRKSVDFCKKALKHKRLNSNPDGYNIGVNDGEAAGRTVNHLHLHLIPRYNGDVENAVGGVRSVIPKMRNYKD